MLHIESLRTIHTRLGYDKHTFYPKGGIALSISYAFGLPFVFLDSPGVVGFALYLAKAWRKYWLVLLWVKVGILVSMYMILSFHIEDQDDETIRAIGQTYFSVTITVLLFMIFPWAWKIYTLIFWIVPW